MGKQIRILHLEDVESDALLVKRELKKSDLSFDYLWVSNKTTYKKGLVEFAPDIVLSDHSLVAFTSQEALQTLKQLGIRIPFILITGTMPEEFIVEMMKEGIHDYLLKDRLFRLPNAITNAIEKTNSEKEKEKYIAEIISKERKYRALIENISDAILLVDPEGHILFNSPSVKRISGFEAEEFSMKKIFDYFHEDELAENSKIFESALANPFVPIQNSFRILHKKGGYIWTEGVIINLLNDESVKAFIVIYRDITERKVAELEKSKMASDIFQRNQDLEQFANIISHNLRSPVANIIGISNLIVGTNNITTEDHKKLVNGLALSTKKLDEIIIDLNYILDVRQEKNEKKQMILFNDIVKDVTDSIKDVITREGVVIETDFKAAAHIFTVKSYCYSIFYNLISNSIKYRKQYGKTLIKITSDNVGDGILLTFQDNGIGIDLKTHGSKIFGLYKKFHEDIEGKGMGLYMVKTQVEILGGKIDVKSKVDEGTVFLINV